MNQATSLLSALFTTLLLATAAHAAPAPGTPAPAFELLDQDGNTHQLADYRGKWLVLYFYPKDDTPGCTTQACEFRDNIFAYRRLGAEIVGISVDDVASHQAFAEKHSLPFPLLADDGGEVAREYGVLRNFGVMKLASRQTFLVSPDGMVARHYEKVDVDTHSAEVIADLEVLAAAD
ncbi:MAG: peroxiredoxin [Gammaproteobacteria bacterium]|jgi:peroxiredoxin Q/BCP